MRKYSFLIYHKVYLEFLEKIREIGVLHVIEKAEGISEDEKLNASMQQASAVKMVLDQLDKKLSNELVLEDAKAEDEGPVLLEKFENIFKDIELLKSEIQTAKRELDRISMWGDFSVERINDLQANGFEVKFFNANNRKYRTEWEDEFNAFPIATIGSIIYFITVNKVGTEVDIDADPVNRPEKNTKEVQALIQTLQKQIGILEKQLLAFAKVNYNSLEKYYQEILGEIDFSKVVLNTLSEVDNKVMLLEGYCPDEVENQLKDYLEVAGVFYEVTNPDITENIPIKLKNNAFSKLFEPITKLFSLPNYSELDPTPFLAPFFMLFFGLCLGDGGYGLIVWLVATFAKRKAKREMKGLLTLGQYLGLATLVVGILTGSFLGISLDQVEWEWLTGVKQYFVTEGNFGEQFGGYNPMMVVAVVIGMIQILFGMIINGLKIMKQHGFKHAVGQLSWVVFIVSMIVYVIFSAKSIPPFIMYVLYVMMGASVLFILFYNSPGKNLFVNLGSALWRTYNMATGLLGDTLSYIRLFALGLTGSILGGVFNMLAIDLTTGIDFIPAKWLAMLLILLFGHTINFALCLIGAFVHPLRLTFVEFYKNAGFEGGGRDYKPFKKIN